MSERKMSALNIGSPQTNAIVAEFQHYPVDLYASRSLGGDENAWEIDDAKKLMARVASLQSPVSPGMLSFSSDTSSIEERLFDATSAVKILISQVSMHMPKEWRDKLFRQIDSLHDFDEWDGDDEPVERSSFESFLKVILYIKPQRHPGLGLSYDGHLVAAWTTGKDRLTTEFHAKDRVHWVVTRDLDGETERAAGQTVASRLYECLTPYNPRHWFSRE